MKSRIVNAALFMLFTICCLTGILSCGNTEAYNRSDEEKNTGMLFPKGEKITNDNFTGTVYLQSLVEADSINANSVGNVSFDAGARSNWHIHPAGQLLLVTDGVGYYQEKGQNKKILRRGDVIKCPPNVPHWHGASVDSAFVQVAITGRERGATVWLEKVTDEEYIK